MIWFFLGAGLLVILLFVIVPFRVIFFHLIATISYTFRDLFLYVLRRSWNYAPVGFIYAFTGLFGQGKTLSSVNYVVRYFKRYNNKKVYDPFRKCWVTQYVNVLSNVKLSIPYVEFVSLKQIVNIASNVSAQNKKNNARFITIVFGDEFSVQLNSRNFKANLDPLTLATILTCRHHGICMLYTAQRFQHVDALLRQVTERVAECHKLWRIQCLTWYDGWKLENSVTVDKVKPVRRSGWFVRQRDYEQYDSIATVKNLIADYKAGNLFSEQKILELQGYSSKVSVDMKTKKR